MLTRRRFATLSMSLAALAPIAAVPLRAEGTAPAERLRFAAIEGGQIDLADYAGRPVLVVNTASRCGFTKQYDDMQALYDQYRDRGLVVLAVPSDDFGQELKDNGAVRDFCEVTFGLDFPMTEITSVRGKTAHPFFAWLAREHDFVPSWNFSKVLIAPDGRYAGSWGSITKPTSGAITRRIEAFLG